MRALFAGLTTVDIIHALDHEPDTGTKTTSVDYAIAAGGPATNAAIACAHLSGVEDHTALLTTIGKDPITAFLHSDIESNGVSLLDATDITQQDVTPAISSIIEHPGGRMVASTNALVDADVEAARTALATYLRDGAPDVVLIDGHHLELAELALSVGTHSWERNGEEPDDPFADIEDRPRHMRILDGGSWKPWLMPLLGHIDIAVISADFCPPVTPAGDGESIADFLRGFGIRYTIRTQGPGPIQWWWDGDTGSITPTSVNAISTMGAGDIFHGAFAHAVGSLTARGETLPAAPHDLVTYAQEIATASTTSFGTRRWMDTQKSHNN